MRAWFAGVTGAYMPTVPGGGSWASGRQTAVCPFVCAHDAVVVGRRAPELHHRLVRPLLCASCRSTWATTFGLEHGSVAFGIKVAAGRAVRCGHARTLASHVDRTERSVAECVVAFPQVKPKGRARTKSCKRGLGVRVPSPALFPAEHLALDLRECRVGSGFDRCSRCRFVRRVPRSFLPHSLPHPNRCARTQGIPSFDPVEQTCRDDHEPSRRGSSHRACDRSRDHRGGRPRT